MLLFRDVACNLYYKESNNSVKVQKFECTVVCQSGIASFIIYEVGMQFLLDEKNLRDALLEYKSTETDGIYINFTNENVIPTKCKIKLDVNRDNIKFQILYSNNFIEIETESLKEILDIK